MGKENQTIPPVSVKNSSVILLVAIAISDAIPSTLVSFQSIRLRVLTYLAVSAPNM